MVLQYKTFTLLKTENKTEKNSLKQCIVLLCMVLQYKTTIGKSPDNMPLAIGKSPDNIPLPSANLQTIYLCHRQISRQYAVGHRQISRQYTFAIGKSPDNMPLANGKSPDNIPLLSANLQTI
jgi:hypothetical protein